MVDCENLGLDFAQRCVADGHEVRWARDKFKLKDGHGFKGVEIVEDWRDHMKWARDGLIFMTGNAKWCRELDRYREHGFEIFGPTERSAALEIQRSVGLEAMEKAGIEVPEYQTFKTLAEAEAFAWKAQEPFVFKTMGSEDDKSLSFCPSDPAELVAWLQRQQALGIKAKGPFMLQQKIDMLAEVGVSGWFGPEGFLTDKWQICFEHKKLMAGEIGPNTGEMGTVCQYVAADKMADAMLKPMEAALLKAGHRGDFAIGCGIDKAGKAWPFEFTARAGWPAFFLQIASHKGDVAQWMRDLLDGKDTLKVSNDVSLGVVVAQPRFPYNDSPPELVEGNPITGLEDIWERMHPCGVMIAKGPVMEGGKVTEGLTYQTTAEYVLCVTALGATVEKAAKRAYSYVEKIGLSNAMYRDDIGEKVQLVLNDLHKLGYATEMNP